LFWGFFNLVYSFYLATLPHVFNVTWCESGDRLLNDYRFNMHTIL